MKLVLHDGRGVQTQNLAQLVSVRYDNPRLLPNCREGGVRTVPHTDHVLLRATSHHHTHHVRILKGLADCREDLLMNENHSCYKVLPQLSKNARGSLHLQNPAATVRERLPFRRP